MEHKFTSVIKAILKNHFGKNSEDIFQNSTLIQYINRKTKSANKGSKARGSFANLYAIYVLVEDYIANDFVNQGDYSTYKGAIYSKLFQRQRELPFGTKLQNHALNNRLNSEFEGWFPTLEILPIIREAASERYWFNEQLIKFHIGETVFNLAPAVIDIINEYINAKQESFNLFIKSCEDLQKLNPGESKKAVDFISSQLAPNVDARLFEIISYAILKSFYHDKKIFWGWERKLDSLKEENLTLYKTGRTNANDGGIDFVMKPLGTFFQVTETLDFKKYFLDIDKLQRYPITFVIKSEEEKDVLLKKIEEDALKLFPVKSIVSKYMSCIEDVINIPILKKNFSKTIDQGYLKDILNEIIVQSKVEFNYEEIKDPNGYEEE